MSADHILDLGPGGGENGGTIIASGTPEEIMKNPASITGAFLVEEKNKRRDFLTRILKENDA